MPQGRIGKPLVLLSLTLLVVSELGCSHRNARLATLEQPATVRPHNTTRATFTTPPTSEGPNDDGIFVGLALSGGGLRSANFSAACMFELERMGVLQHVDCISSVSGGSVTAAYYCLGNEWTPGELQRRLTHSFADDLIFTTIQPWQLAALWFTAYDRSDILADSFQRNLF